MFASLYMHLKNNTLKRVRLSVYRVFPSYTMLCAVFFVQNWAQLSLKNEFLFHYIFTENYKSFNLFI